MADTLNSSKDLPEGWSEVAGIWYKNKYTGDYETRRPTHAAKKKKINNNNNNNNNSNGSSGWFGSDDGTNKPARKPRRGIVSFVGSVLAALLGGGCTHMSEDIAVAPAVQGKEPQPKSEGKGVYSI